MIVNNKKGEDALEINETEWALETAQLEEVCSRIEKLLREKRKSIDEYKEDVLEIRRSMWDNTAHVLSGEFDESVEILQYINSMKQEEQSYQHTAQQIKKLEKMLESPYFARIDFMQDEFDDKEKIYIGMSSLIDNDTMDIIIYDWRAPISSMYYEYELGEASYTVGKRVISGEIDLKRQYKVIKSQLVLMFDSSIKIDDEILQEILSKNADEKMKNIVISIQKEQNKIIRDEAARVLIVQGAAGSGKTSIALHRIAYLLYRHKDEGLNSGNVVIFSPNEIFNDYISDVLPELGEENVHQTTFFEYSRSLITPELQIENLNEQMDFMLSQDRNSQEYRLRKNSIQYKSSMEFLQWMDRYLELLDKEYEGFFDISFNGKQIISQKELEELYSVDYKSYAPVKRLQKIGDRIEYLMKPLIGSRLKQIIKQVEEGDEEEFNVKQVSRARLHNELRELRGRIQAMTEVDAYRLFIGMMKDRGLYQRINGKPMSRELSEMLRHTVGYLSQNKLRYEDIAPYIYFKGILSGSFHIADIRHVVIDEAQDYSYLQFQIIKRLFKYASFTILGDINQAINTYMHTADYKTAAEIFSDVGSEIMTLTKSYRSTREIWQLSENVLPSTSNQQPISRRGELPQLVKFKASGNMDAFVIQRLRELTEQGMKSIAVICKTADQCRQVYDTVKKELQLVNLVASESSKLNSGICILPCYLSKGLEFDAVILYDASSQNYDDEEQRKLMYTMCTRALHKLTILYSGALTSLLNEPGPELVQAIEA